MMKNMDNLPCPRVAPGRCVLCIRGGAVRRLRKRRRLTQHQLGLAVGQDQPYVSKIEHGKIRMVAVKTLQALAQTLETTMEKLVSPQ